MHNIVKSDNGNLTENAIKILEKRYFLKNEKGEVIEDWDKLCRRVAKFVASGEKTLELQKEWEDKFYEMIYNLEFLPSSPTLFNAGTDNPQLNACFVIYPEDSMESIFKAIADSSIIYKSGGGCGFYFGNLRPRNCEVGSTGGIASGPLSFMEVFDKTVEVVKQGSKRRGAALACFPVWHPDIEEFIKCKGDKKSFTNFNISIGITDDFMKAVENNKEFELKHPKSKIVKKVNAKKLWTSIIKQAHKTGDPGLLFIDNINKYNPLCNDKLLTTNPSLNKGTKILTNSGIYNIEELENKNVFVPTLISNDYSEARCILSGKNKQLFEIELEGGHKYYATAEHKWPILNTIDNNYSKICTINLQKNMYLPIPKIKNSLNYGTKGSYDLGFLIGWNLGDGNITIRKDNNHKQIGFIFSEDDHKNGIADKIVNILYNITNFRYKLLERNRDDCTWFELQTTNNELIKIFDEYKVQNKRLGLPLTIWKECNEDFRKGIIDGIFSSDGCVNKDGRIILVSAHKKLIYDISDLLGFYGIKNNIYFSKNKATFPNKKDYNKLYKRYDLTIPKNASINFKNIFKLSNKIKNDKLIKIKDNIQKNLKYNNIKIINIRKTNKFEDVWDLQVNCNSHTFNLSHCITGNCGEVPLESYESCVLGSVNLTKFIKNDEVDYIRLKEVVARGTRFLDNTIDLNKYPIPEIEKASKLNRKIGLGIMGYADMLLQLKIKYDSNEAYKFADQLMNVINKEAFFTSAKLGEEKGNFPNFEHSIFNGKHKTFKKSRYLRNATRTTIAPTGTISVIAGVSSGMEPLFSFEYDRESSEGVKLDWIHPLYKKTMDEYKGKLPDNIKKIFVVAKDIDPEWHLKIQQAFQLHVDNSISKTINMPYRTSIKDIKKIYEKAYIFGLKGVTVFRDGCKGKQVLYDKASQCPICKKYTLEKIEGCKTCRSCGWSACSINKVP